MLHIVWFLRYFGDETLEVLWRLVIFGRLRRIANPAGLAVCGGALNCVTCDAVAAEAA